MKLTGGTVGRLLFILFLAVTIGQNFRMGRMLKTKFQELASDASTHSKKTTSGEPITKTSNDLTNGANNQSRVDGEEGKEQESSTTAQREPQNQVGKTSTTDSNGDNRPIKDSIETEAETETETETKTETKTKTKTNDEQKPQEKNSTQSESSVAKSTITTTTNDNKGSSSSSNNNNNNNNNNNVKSKTLKGEMSAESVREVAKANNRTITWDYDEWFLPDGRPKYPTKQDDEVLFGNYYSLVLSGRFGRTSQDILPIKLMEDYKRYHGRSRLEAEWKHCTQNRTETVSWAELEANCPRLAERQFVVGRYSCPVEAGNRMFKYMNHLLWATMTGRTFLSGYFDEASCLEEVDEITGECTDSINPQSDCDSILEMSAWVPKFDDWNGRLHLPKAVRVDGINPKGYDKMGRPYDQAGLPRVIRVGQQVQLTAAMYLHHGRPRKQLLRRGRGVRMAEEFMSLGYYFFYGMLFESVFSLRPLVYPDRSYIGDPSIYQTMMIHSRHPNSVFDGAYVGPEALCMGKVQKLTGIRPPCVVYVMSDREKSIEALRRELPISFDCVAVVANHTEGIGLNAEHGVYAGVGFFDDLALAIHARDGFVAPHLKARRGKGIRTSSGLLRSIIEFRRVVEMKPNRTEIASCTQPYDAPDLTSLIRLPV